MAEVFVIGASVHARVIASLLSARPEFVTTDDRAREDRILSERVAGNASAEFYVGVGNNADRGRGR